MPEIAILGISPRLVLEAPNEHKRIARRRPGDFRQGLGHDRALHLVQRGCARSAPPDGKDRAAGSRETAIPSRRMAAGHRQRRRGRSRFRGLEKKRARLAAASKERGVSGLRFTPRARKDLLDVWIYVARKTSRRWPRAKGRTNFLRLFRLADSRDYLWEQRSGEPGLRLRRNVMMGVARDPSRRIAFFRTDNRLFRRVDRDGATRADTRRDLRRVGGSPRALAAVAIVASANIVNDDFRSGRDNRVNPAQSLSARFRGDARVDNIRVVSFRFQHTFQNRGICVGSAHGDARSIARADSDDPDRLGVCDSGEADRRKKRPR